MMAHAKIVIGAPYDDFLYPTRSPQICTGQTSDDALKVSKHPVSPFSAQSCDPICKKGFVVHGPPRNVRSSNLVEHSPSVCFSLARISSAFAQSVHVLDGPSYVVLTTQMSPTMSPARP